MEKVLEFDLEDANEIDTDQLEIVCDPGKLTAVKAQAEAQGLRVAESEITLVPKTPAAPLDESDVETQQQVEELVAHLDALDDVVRVHTNLP